MILAAGLGTRLGELTARKPKALVEVGGRTLLSLAVEKLRRAGARRIVINAHHHAAQIVNAARDAGPGVEVMVEEKILGTGGGARNAAAVLGDTEPVVVHNVDVLSTLSLAALVDAFRAAPCLSLLAVQRRETTRPLAVDESGAVRGRFGDGVAREPGASGSPDSELRPVGFNGIQVLAPGVAGRLPGEGAFSIVDSLLELARGGPPVRAFDMGRAYWLDLGTPERLARAEEDFASGKIDGEALVG